MRDATRDPSVRLLATDGTANWLLWRIPALRGRVAYDVRFEVLDEGTLDALTHYGRLEGDWAGFADGTASWSSTAPSTSSAFSPSPMQRSCTAETTAS